MTEPIGGKSGSKVYVLPPNPVKIIVVIEFLPTYLFNGFFYTKLKNLD